LRVALTARDRSQRGTYDALDGITPPLKRAFYRYREDQSGVSARTIQVAESELSAILKGDNEIIEELQGDAVAKAERELEIHNAAEAKAAEDRAAARQARQLKKRQKLLEPKVDSPVRAGSNASTSSTADTASSAAAAAAGAGAATSAASAAPSMPAPTGSNIIKIALPKPPGSASNSTFKTPAPVDKSSRQNSAIAQTPATPAAVARSTPGMPMLPPTPATPDVAAVLRFAPPSSVKSEPMTEDNNNDTGGGGGGDGEKKLSKEERKAAKKAAKAAKKAAREAAGGGADDDDDALNIDEIDLMAIDVPVAPPTTNSVGGFKIKIKMSSGSAPAQTAPTPAPPTVKAEVADAPTAVLQPAPPVAQQPAAVLTSSSVPPPPQPSSDPAYEAATARVAECETKLQAAQKALEEDEAKAASAPNPIYAQKLKSKVATTAAARDAAQAELDAARAAVQRFGQQ
jgi:hypothetical protein